MAQNAYQLFHNSCIDFLGKCRGFSYIEDKTNSSFCVINPFFFYHKMVKICFITNFYNVEDTNCNFKGSYIRVFAQDFNSNFQLISFGFISKSNYSIFFKLLKELLSSKPNINKPEIFFSFQPEVESYIKENFPECQLIYHRSVFKHYLDKLNITSEWLGGFDIESFYAHFLNSLDSKTTDNLFSNIKSIYHDFPVNELTKIIDEWKHYYNSAEFQQYSLLKNTLPSIVSGQSIQTHLWYSTVLPSYPIYSILPTLLHNSYNGFKFLYEYNIENFDYYRQIKAYLSKNNILNPDIFKEMNQNSIEFIFSYYLFKSANKSGSNISISISKSKAFETNHLYEKEMFDFVQSLSETHQESNIFIIDKIQLLPDFTLSFRHVMLSMNQSDEFEIPAISPTTLKDFAIVISQQRGQNVQLTKETFGNIICIADKCDKQRGRKARYRFKSRANFNCIALPLKPSRK